MSAHHIDDFARTLEAKGQVATTNLYRVSLWVLDSLEPAPSDGHHGAEMSDRSEPQPFLDPAEIQRNCAFVGLSAEASQAFLDFAAQVCADARLLKAAAIAHHCLYETQIDCTPTIKQVEAAFGDDASALRALMVLDSIRLIREKQTARNVPNEIMRAALESNACAVLRDYYAQNGHIGADEWIWPWYRAVGSGHLYGLGRLEFLRESWDYPWRVFSNDATGKVIVMLNAGLRFADDGYRSDEFTWVTTLQDLDEELIGHQVLQDGRADRTSIHLARNAWREVLGPGDIVLDMHVAAGSPLTLDLIRDSMHQAELFFDHYYPGQPAKAFVCDSWLFSPELKHFLPPESNIMRWQREGYLLPNDSDGSVFLSFVFGTSSIDPATAPRDTRLRRAVIEHIEKGGRLHCGGYLLLRKDLPRFGSQPYCIASGE